MGRHIQENRDRPRHWIEAAAKAAIHVGFAVDVVLRKVLATYHAAMVAANAAAHKIDAFIAIDASTARSGAFLLSRVVHKHKIAF